MARQLHETLSLGKTQKNSSHKGLMAASLIIKGSTFSFYNLELVEEFVLGCMGIATLQLGLGNLLYWYDWKVPNGMKEEDIDVEENRVYHGVYLDHKV
ncbi:unnamed protein product [Prunus armeniaca]